MQFTAAWFAEISEVDNGKDHLNKSDHSVSNVDCTGSEL